MLQPLDRRTFLGAAAAGVAAGWLTSPRTAFARSANQQINVGVMGVGGRGRLLSKSFESLDGVRVAYVCDVDTRRVDQAAEEVAAIHGNKPVGVADFRRILDDPAIDALVIATCNHWHAPAAILGCTAGKHVYVEKPCSHNPAEGELMVEAARRHDRRVQMGNQRRSNPAIIEAIAKLHDGAIGRPYFARCAYQNKRTSIGTGKVAVVPSWLDYDLWQGPAPRRDYRDNVIHYNWHWFWHWGNGELGNNGVHTLDVCRWGLGVDFPSQVTSTGGRYHYQDDQETPDSQVVSFNYPDQKTISWTGSSCNGHPLLDAGEVEFRGTEGTMVLNTTSYVIYDAKDKEIGRSAESSEDHSLNSPDHQANFVAAIREGTPLNSEIGEGHKSTMLSHLGNIAQRTGRTLHCDTKDGRIADDADAMKLWAREYEPGWEPKV